MTARTHFARQLLKRDNAVRRQGVRREWIVAARSNYPFAEGEQRCRHLAGRYGVKVGVVR